MADVQQSSIFQDWYPAETQLERNVLCDGAGLKQHTNMLKALLCSCAAHKADGEWKNTEYDTSFSSPLFFLHNNILCDSEQIIFLYLKLS